MSCEENRSRYLAAVCEGGAGGPAQATELERVFQRERGEPADALEAADNEAKTRLLFAQFGRCDPPLRPPTHSADGLPKRDAQRGYARLWDRLGTLAGQGHLRRCPDCGQFGVAPGHPTCTKGQRRNGETASMGPAPGSRAPGTAFPEPPGGLAEAVGAGEALASEGEADGGGEDEDDTDAAGDEDAFVTPSAGRRWPAVLPPRQPTWMPPVRYDAQGFNAQGFNAQGFNAQGRDRAGYDAAGLDAQGFNRWGFDRAGRDRQGRDWLGFGPDGYNEEGLDPCGYNRQGRDAEGRDKQGYDAQGVDARGYTRQGYDRQGQDAYGFNPAGVGPDGWDIRGYRQGWDADGYDEQGLDPQGLGRDGYTLDGHDARGYLHPWLVPDADGCYGDGLDAQGYDRDGYNPAGRDRWGFGRDGFNQFGRDRSGRSGLGIGRDGTDPQGYTAPGFDAQGRDRLGFDAQGLAASGYSVTGYDRDGYDAQGLDRWGRDRNNTHVASGRAYKAAPYNRAGYDKHGFDRWGFHRETGLTADGRNYAGWVYDPATKECVDPADPTRRMPHRWEWQRYPGRVSWTRPAGPAYTPDRDPQGSFSQAEWQAAYGGTYNAPRYQDLHASERKQEGAISNLPFFFLFIFSVIIFVPFYKTSVLIYSPMSATVFNYLGKHIIRYNKLDVIIFY